MSRHTIHNANNQALNLLIASNCQNNVTHLLETVMNTLKSTMERAEFIDLLSAEFTHTKGFGVYAFLSFNEIESAYHRFLNSPERPSVFVRLFVKSLG